MDCTHPSFTYVLMHLSVGGGLAVTAIAVAAATALCVFFWSMR